MGISLLDQLLDPVAACLTVDSARKIADLKADADLQDHVDQLADKANRGELSDEERLEYDRFLAAFHFVSILQARARRLLRE